ncbi:MAG: CHASE3 domain-containing protein [Casimicrobiaceae bacterium]
MKIRLPRGVWLGLLLIAVPSIALLALDGYVATAMAPQLSRNREEVAHTFDVITAAQMLHRSVQDAERGQRGFLLSGDTSDLAPYTRALDDIPVLLTRFRQLAGGNAEYLQRALELDDRISAKLHELAESLRLYGGQGPAAAREFVQSNVGQKAMESITALIDGAVVSQSFALTDQLATATMDERRIALLTKIGGGLAIVIMAFGMFLGWLSLRKILSADAARHESEERFRMFVEGVSDYAIYLLDPHGNVSSWNVGAQRIKGFTADEIVGRHFSMFYAPEDRADGAPERALATARAGKYETEAWRVRKNGERFFASIVINPIRDRQGALIGFAKITRDISERLLQEQALDKARAQLAQSQKMEALGQLSGGVAHDFNNVLHVINNSVAILHPRLEAADPEMLRVLDMIRRNVDRASSLTQRLLSFSRTQPLEPKPVDPNALVAGMVDLLRQTLGSSVAIETVLSPATATIFVDANHLETAIVNLAVNARDAMPNGGVLTIETGAATLDVAFTQRHPDVRPGEYATITVRDNGTGMSEEVRDKAFEPFFTTKAPGQGTGLGLSQVFGLIKQSSGHVTIDSVPDGGTTVTLYLPKVAEVAGSENATVQVAAG